MPWNVLVVRLPKGTERIDALPADYWPPSFEEVGTKLRVIPDIEMYGEGLAVVRSADWVVEIDFSTPSRVVLSIEGSEGSISIVRSIATILDAIAIDTTSGEAIDFHNDPTSGLRLSRKRQELLDDVADSATSANDLGRAKIR